MPVGLVTSLVKIGKFYFAKFYLHESKLIKFVYEMMMNTVCRIYLLLFIVHNLKYVQVE